VLEKAARDTRRGGTHDETTAARAHLVGDIPKTFALALGCDLTGNTDVIDRRHKDEVAPGQADVRGHPRALGADRVFHDLNEDLLAFLELLLDRRNVASASCAAATVLATVFVAIFNFERIVLGVNVGDVEETGFFEPDVDKGGLHAREHARDAAFVDVADHTTVALSLEVEVCNQAVFESGHPGLLGGRINDKQIGHT
jgi:hypothetical protein